MKNLICIIPARAGSKGIKNKNIKILKKKPLINYTLEFAKNYLKDSRIIISTDSKKILKLANLFGFVENNLRPKKLASDNSLIYDVVKYEISRIEKQDNKEYKYILLLQPTCPFRNFMHLKTAFNLIKNKKFDSVVSVSEVGSSHPERMKVFKNNYLKNFLGKLKENMIPRQKLKKVYIRSGAYYLIKKDCFLRNNSLVAKKCAGIIVDGKYKINIDDISDFILAENC